MSKRHWIVTVTRLDRVDNEGQPNEPMFAFDAYEETEREAINHVRKIMATALYVAWPDRSEDGV